MNTPHEMTANPKTGDADALQSRPAHGHAMRVVLWLDTKLIWVVRSRQRRALAELDARQLSDIGITPAAARAEAAKPWWQ